MTRPAIIWLLGPNRGDTSKIMIRALIYSTSDQGHYIQSMFLRVYRGETIQNFNIWAYGDTNIVRGSGLYVNKTGVSILNRFHLHKNEPWEFVSGNYKLEVYAELVNNKLIKLSEQKISLNESEAVDLRLNNPIQYWPPVSVEMFPPNCNPIILVPEI